MANKNFSEIGGKRTACLVNGKTHTVPEHNVPT